MSSIWKTNLLLLTFLLLTFLPLSPLTRHGANGYTHGAVAGFAGDIHWVWWGWSEHKAVGITVILISRWRPIATIDTYAIGVFIIDFARTWKEDAIAVIFTGELHTFHTIERRQLLRASANQLPYISHGRHTPIAAPLLVNHVVFRVTDVIANVYILAILIILVCSIAIYFRLL